MKATILPDGNLEISIDTDEQEELRYVANTEQEVFQSDAFMCELFEPLTCNSEYDWVNPEYTGALTSAPMLGVYGEDKILTQDINYDYVRVTGCGGVNTYYSPVIKNWAFMDYAVISPQEQLLNTGKAIFTKGHGQLNLYRSKENVK